MITFKNGEVLLEQDEARLVGEFLLDLENTSACDFMSDEDLKALKNLVDKFGAYDCNRG